MAMNTEDALREYLRLFVRVPLVGRIGPLARTFDFVADAAPGVKEILGVGKLAYEVRERHYDLVVVDAEASGHIVAQVGAPRVIGDLDPGRAWCATRPGGCSTSSRTRTRTGVVVVTTPEEMPVVETIELLDRLAAETRVAPAGDRRQPRAAGAVRPQGVRGRRAASAEPTQLLVDAAGPGVRDVVLAAQLTEARRRRRRPPPRAPARRLRAERLADPLRARAVHPGDRAPGRRARRRSARPTSWTSA